MAESKRRRLIAILQQYQLVIWLVLTLGLGSVFVFTVPPWQHPDEPTHFEHVRMIAQLDRLPNPMDVDLSIRKDIALSMLRNKFWRDIQPPQLDDLSLSKPYNSPLGIYTLGQPRLYYQVASVWLKPWLSQQVDTQLYAVRMLSVVFGMCVVLCAYLCSRWLFGAQSHITPVVCALIVFLPGFTDIMSAVNNDGLVNLFSAVFLLLLIWGVSHRINLLSGLILVALMALSLWAAFATKATVIGLAVAVPVGLIAAGCVRIVLFSRSHQRLRRWLLVISAALFVVVAAGIVVLAVSIATQSDNLEIWLSNYLRINVSGTLHNLLSPQSSYDQVVTVVFRSYFAVFGWRHIYIADSLYVLLALGTVGVVLGLVVWMMRMRHQPADITQRLMMFMVFAVMVVLGAWLAAILRSQADQGMTSLYHSHGRYAYIALVPSAILAAVGMVGWLEPRWRRRAVLAVMLLVITFDAVCFWGYLVPHYYIVPMLGIH